MIELILFDAVGTLIRPFPGVADTYWEAGRQCGSRLTRSVIQVRFHEAVKRHFAAEDPTCPDTPCGEALYGDTGNRDTGNRDTRPYRETSAEGERNRWRAIVAEVFHDVTDTGPLFERLWTHFSRPDSWRLYPDVRPTWRQLRAAGYRLGIASNFDHRLESICRGLPPLADSDFLLHSADLGYAKPDPRFYQAVCRRLGLLASRILLVGDDPLHDYHGPRRAGFEALWLRRDEAANGGAGEVPAPEKAPSGRITSLLQVPEILRLAR